MLVEVEVEVGSDAAAEVVVAEFEVVTEVVTEAAFHQSVDVVEIEYSIRALFQILFWLSVEICIEHLYDILLSENLCMLGALQVEERAQEHPYCNTIKIT